MAAAGGVVPARHERNMAITGKRIVILGGGVTGLTAAAELSKARDADVVVVENEAATGGLATTLTRDGFTFDTGSHRLHDDCDAEAMALIKELCGNDLLRRERRGLIHLHGRALPYPPSAFDVVFGFGAGDALRFIADFTSARLRRHAPLDGTESFESFIVGKVGQSLYERFYKPYAVKLYGICPRSISVDAAVTRVRKFTLVAIYNELKTKLRSRPAEYLYPARGIGQLAHALQTRFEHNGGRLVFISQIDRLQIDSGGRITHVHVTTHDGRHLSLPADVVISTIPLDTLHHLVVLPSENGSPPTFDLQWRSLRLLYMATRDRIPSNHETFYFPDPEIVFGRVSELNKYSPFLNQGPGPAALAIEIPCSYADETWNCPDEQLGDRCIRTLQQVGILRVPASDTTTLFSKKLRTVYPVCDLGWRERFGRIYRRLNGVDNLYLVGRTALFLHCNIDHCMAMALAVSRYVVDGHIAKDEWDRVQQPFVNYRVRE
jgi:protoporphyrinogen oxidase